MITRLTAVFGVAVGGPREAGRGQGILKITNVIGIAVTGPDDD